MSEYSGREWFRMAILGAALIVGMTVVGFSVAEGTEEAPLPASAGEAADLFGVRIRARHSAGGCHRTAG